MLPLAISRPTLNAPVQREEGFTLIEILLVAAVIGILAAIAVPNFVNQRHVGNDAIVTADMGKVMNAVEPKYREDPAAYISQESFPSIQIDDDTKFTVTSNAELGYCIALWNPKSSEHKTADSALINEPLGANTCAAFGITGTEFGATK